MIFIVWWSIYTMYYYKYMLWMIFVLFTFYRIHFFIEKMMHLKFFFLAFSYSIFHSFHIASICVSPLMEFVNTHNRYKHISFFHFFFLFFEIHQKTSKNWYPNRQLFRKQQIKKKTKKFMNILFDEHKQMMGLSKLLFVYDFTISNYHPDHLHHPDQS